jgi:predicted MFS family arabinose efflux permease
MFGVIGCIIGMSATGYHSLLACRIVTGFSTSAYESVIIAALGDLFFVHQRGPRISLVNFMLAGVSNGYPNHGVCANVQCLHYCWSHRLQTWMET